MARKLKPFLRVCQPWIRCSDQRCFKEKIAYLFFFFGGGGGGVGGGGGGAMRAGLIASAAL